MIEDVVPLGSPLYWFFLALLVVARSLDFLSTWIATPGLVLEANPIARMLGWRWGAIVNAVVCGLVAQWPLPAIVLATTSILVAARNFQSAWLMRSMGEAEYRAWLVERVAHSRRGLFLFCLVAQSVLAAVPGVALIYFSGWHLVFFGMGTGIVAYAAAVLAFNLLGAVRVWRHAAQVAIPVQGRMTAASPQTQA